MAQAKLPKQLSTYQEGNFEEKCACWKIVCFLIFFPNNQQKKFLLFAFVFRQCFESCFVQRRGKLDFFSFPEGVRFTNISGHWVRTLMQSGNILKQFHQNCSLRSLCNLFVKKVFFVRFHQSSFWDIFWKKIEFLVEIFWRFTMFFATSAKFFSMSPQEFLRKTFPMQWVFPFCKTERWKIGSLTVFSGRIVKPAL